MKLFFPPLQPPPPLVKVIEDLPNNTLSSSNLKMKMVSGRVQRPARSKESRIQTRILKQDLEGNVENKEVRMHYNSTPAYCDPAVGSARDFRAGVWLVILEVW